MIEQDNAKEEITELLEKCNKCGLCKELCPVFKIIREEQFSPRGHAILLSNKTIDKIVFDCTLCKACEEKCLFNLKICKAIKRARQILNLKEKDNQKSKEMLKKFEEKKNPFVG